MPGLSVADATGTYRTAKQLWVADGTGTYQSAKAGYVADATGTYRLGTSSGLAISSFTVAKGSPSWTRIALAWTAGNALGGYRLYRAGVATPVYTGSATSYTFIGAPNTTYSFYLRAFAADGITFVASSTLTITTDSLGAPSNFRQNGGNSQSTPWLWNPVADATGYDLVDTLTAGQPTKWSGSATSVTETGLAASTVYERAVRAKVGSSLSGLSSKIRYTTPNRPGPAAGNYAYGATTQTAVWAPGRNNWRPDSDGIIHGNGDNWGGGNGNQCTYFMYNNRPWLALAGGRVTRFKIRLRRDNAAGYSSAQGCHFGLHGYASARPAGAPGYLAPLDAGSLAWGQEATIDLPVSWGQSLVDNSNWGGIAWGDVGGRYMRGPSPAAYSGQGQLIFTIG